MRLSTVFSVTALGGLIGAAAVLVPLSSQPPGSPGAWIMSLALDIARHAPPSKSDDGPASTAPTPASPDSDFSAINGQATSRVSDAPVQAALPPWSAQVTIVETSVPVRLTSSRVGSEKQRVELSRQIQHQLKRVGCYDGAMDGNWAGGTKAAMGAFLTKVNATLPHNDPDYILLTLLEGHVDKACGVSCTSGQTTGSSGRCAPAALQAQSISQPHTVAPATGAVVDTARLTGVMPVPVPRQAIVPNTTVATKSISTGRANLDLATLPTEEINLRTATPRPARVPLPGRMSVGGPLPPPLTNAAKDEPSETASKPDVARLSDDMGLSSKPDKPVTAARVPATQTLNNGAGPKASRFDNSGRDRSRAELQPRSVTVLRPVPPLYVARPRADASSARQRQRSRKVIVDLFEIPNWN